MIKINIDEIINELKKTNEWKIYLDFIKIHKNDFGDYRFKISHFIGKKGILDGKKVNIKDNKIDEKKIDEIWKWSKREKNFESFKILEQKFVDIFLKKVKFCPYCGKIPLIRYSNDKNEKKGTYHLDHIFPKTQYRYLTYNFYNLIPACSICNQLKGQKNITKQNQIKIFHPYFGFIKKKYGRNIAYSKKKLGDDFLDLKYKSNTKFYNLDKIYDNAQDTHNDINFIMDKIYKIKTDKNNLKDNFSLDERKKHYFKNFYTEKEEDLLKYTNGKLKRKLINDIKLG